MRVMAEVTKWEINNRQARKLWDLLRAHFVNFEQTLEQIVETRAWEPLGYLSFADAWNDRMSDITLAAEVRPHVAYAYFDQGASIEEVAEGVKGLGHAGAENLHRQKEIGVPASNASLHARPKRRVRDERPAPRPAAPDTIEIVVGVTKYKRYQRIAAKNGVTVEETAKKAIDWAFQDLA